MTSARHTRLAWAAGVAVFVLAALASLGVFIAKQPYGYDLWAYVLAAQHLAAGEPLYPSGAPIPYGPFGEYHYAPPVAVPFLLLAPLPFWLATAVWIGINTGIATAIAVHLIRPLPRDARPWAAAAYVLFLPTILEISLGNLNLLTLGLCLLAWSQRARPVVGGSLLAIAIGVKLLPLTLVLFYIASGRARLVAWTVVVAVVGFALTAAVFARDLPSYISLVLALKDSQWAAEIIASTPPAEVADVLGSPIGRSVLPFAAVLTAVAGGIAARLARRDESHLHHLALAYAPYLASFGLLWFPYLVLALPLMASTLQRSLAIARQPTRALLVAGLALSWLLLQVIGERNDVVPIAAHLLGLLVLLAVSVLVLALARGSETVRENATARAAA